MHTAGLAKDLATLLGGTSVVWSTEERKKSAFRVANLKRLGAGSREERYSHCFGRQAGAGADATLRDPNFRLKTEVLDRMAEGDATSLVPCTNFSLWRAQASPDTSAWAEQMRAVFVRSRELGLPCVAVDVVGYG